MISTANGRPILRCSLRVPRVGVWHAEVSVEAEDTTGLQGAVELVLGGATWQGFARRSGAHEGRVELLVVGGAGGLSTELDPRYYADAPVSVPLGDLMRETGETLSSTVLADITSPLLSRWVRPRCRGGRALADLAAALDVDAWRVLADGTVWVGDETWPDVELEHDVLEEDPAHDRAVLAVDELSLAPGSVLEGRGLSYVLHLVAPDSLRSVVWYETPGQAGAPASSGASSSAVLGGSIVQG